MEVPHPLRVGLIGAGGIAGTHLQAYARFPQVIELVAVCDLREEAARQRAEAAGIRMIYTDPLRMLKEAAIEAVDICTTPNHHAELAIAAAGMGKHVLVEKPMACSLQQCRAMVQAAEQCGVTLMVAQNQRYDPVYQGVRQAIEAGELGPIRAFRFDAMQHMPAFADPGHWYYDGKQAGGGVVISIAIHRIDLMRYFLGEVRRVTATCRTTDATFLYGAENFACAVLELEKGAVGEMFATASAFRLPWSESFMLFGEDGMIYSIPLLGHAQGPAFIASRRYGGPARGWDKQFTDFIPVEPYQENVPTVDSYLNEIIHFAQCCQSGREPLSSGKDNLGTMKVVFGIYESASACQPVDLSTL